MMAWLGMHPVAHVVVGDRSLQIGLAAFAISRDGAFAFLAVFHLALFFIAAKFAARYRDALTAAEMNNELHAWQLRHLVPPEATSALKNAPELA